MKKFIHIVCIVACFLIYKNASSDPIVTFFIKPYPVGMDTEYDKEIVTKFGKPGKLAKQHFYGFGRQAFTVGIFSTYAGFLNASDANGQTIFPRKTEKPAVSLIITSKLTPMIMSGVTVHHWELEEGTPAHMYLIEQHTDAETQITYWNCEQTELPHNRIIPTNAIVVFAEPKYIYVPTGISPTTISSNLVLPPIYTKRGVDTLNNALYLLNIKQFFGPLDSLYKVQPKHYSQLVVE